MSEKKYNNFEKILNFSTPFLLVTVIFIVLLFSAESQYKKYEILFTSEKEKYEENVVVEVTIDGVLEGTTYNINDISRRNLYSSEDIKIFNYNGYTFYAYTDDTITTEYLLGNNISPFMSAITPVNIDSEKDKVIYKREYIEPNMRVYKIEIFDYIAKIESNFIYKLQAFIKGYWNYITSGDGLVLLLSACMGGLIINIINYIILKLFKLLSKIIVKKRRS